MLIKLKCTLDNGKTKLPPGEVIEVDDDYGIKLIREKCAVAVNIGASVNKETGSIRQEVPGAPSDDEVTPPSDFTPEEHVEWLAELPFIDEEQAKVLYESGHTVTSIAELEDLEVLTVFDGIGEKTAEKIVDAAKEMVNSSNEESE